MRVVVVVLVVDPLPVVQWKEYLPAHPGGLFPHLFMVVKAIFSKPVWTTFGQIIWIVSQNEQEIEHTQEFVVLWRELEKRMHLSKKPKEKKMAANKYFWREKNFWNSLKSVANGMKHPEMQK